MFTFHYTKNKRKFLPESFSVNKENIQGYYEELLHREIYSLAELETWMLNRSELESVLEEDFAWRYIRTTINTADEQAKKDFEYFATEIEPKIAEYSDLLNRKFIDSPYTDQLGAEKYKVYIRSIKNQLELFRAENIPLLTELQVLQQKFGAIAGAMSIDHEGKTFTLEQASVFLQDQNRDLRRNIYEKIQARRISDKVQLDELFGQLLKLRHQVALNAGFENYRDYMFRAMGRFDYSVQDCLDFHDAIEQEVVPVLKLRSENRCSKMQLDSLQPYDTEVDISGKPALKPFENGEELINKTIACFERLHPYTGACLRWMKDHEMLDLESRIGKAPGGYNYPLAETGAPFIFMNSAGTLRDLTTMVHEGGHAVHTFISNDLPLNDFKHVPSEVAELASMSMELLSMDYWDEFFHSEDDLKRAKEEQIRDVLKTLPWVACIDAFQHWIYTHPQHTATEREQEWEKIFDRFGANFVDWNIYPEYKKNIWQKQLHLFEVPFYYIEYAIAQLGAIAIYKNYKDNPEKGLENYLQALKMGYSKPIPDLYKTAGIKFNFSSEYIRELISFVNGLQV